MELLDKKLVESCKEAVADVESKKFPSFDSSFSQRLKKAQETGDKDLELLMKLLMGLFSMYFKFAKGQPFGPLATWTDGRRTMLPEDLQEDELNKLEEIVQTSNNPEFLARICDVLWIRQKNHLYARKAIKAYLQSVDEDKDECWVPRSEWLKRATQIAMELGEKDKEIQAIKTKLLDLFEESRKICHNPKQDYWPSSLLEIIIENKLADNWEEPGDKSVEIAKGFPISPGCDAPRKYYRLAAECYDYANKPAKAKDAKLAIAKHWEEEARSFKTPQGCDGFNLAHRLEKAIQAYREVGEKEKAEALVHELKEANKLSLTQMKPIIAEMDVTPLIKLADDSLKDKNGMDAIMEFISLSRPHPYDNAEQSAKKLIQDHPLQAVIDTVILTSEGNVSERIPGAFSNNEERLKAEIIKQYNLGQDLIAATTFKRGISIILESDGTWKDAIRELVNTNKFVPEGRQDIYERALIAGFEGDLMVFTHLIIPQIENSIRLIFGTNKLKITSVLPSGVQREKDLNELLTDANAEQIFSKDLLWEMRSLLIEQSGPNLRNRICHGLMNSKAINDASSIFLLWLTLFLLVGFK
jgi:hypothetical protein